MNLFKKMLGSGLLVLSLALLVGCGGGAEDEGSNNAEQPDLENLQQVANQETEQKEMQLSEVDAKRELSEIETEAKAMSDDQLRTMAEKYKEAFFATQTDFNEAEEKLKGMSITELAEGGAVELQEDSRNFLSTLEGLMERFQVYYDQLEENGGDVSGLDF